MDISSTARSTDSVQRSKPHECSPDCPAYDYPDANNGLCRDEKSSPVGEEDVAVGHAELTVPNLYDQLEDWQTRVLTLEPGGFGMPLVAKLHTVNLLYDAGTLIHGTNTRLYYDALSYCWGDSKRCRQLTCNKQPLSITQEAHKALQRLRSPTEHVNLWVDAICINQDDNDEKAHQVRKMLTIFKKAIRVRVWLGEHEGSMLLAARWLAGLPHLLDSSYVTSSFSVDQPPISWSKWSSLCTRHWNDVLDGLVDMLNLPWFRRVWVLQEIWAAQSVIVTLADSAFSWQALLRLSEEDVSFFRCAGRPEHWTGAPHISLRLIRSQLTTGDPVTFALAESKKFQPNRRLKDDYGQRLDIINVIRRSMGSDCTLPHDRVFGLLGMATAPVQSEPLGAAAHDAITIDYNRSANAVFEDVAKYVIQRDKCLTILYLSELCRRQGAMYSPGNPLKLPSWVPDFRMNPGATECLYDSEHCHRRYFSSTSCDLISPMKEGMLHLQGIRLGILMRPTGMAHERLEMLNSGYNDIGIGANESALCKADLFEKRPRVPDRPYLRHRGSAMLDLRILQGDESPETEDNPLKAWKRFDSESGYNWYWEVPSLAREGDIVVVVKGGRLPLVLRPMPDQESSFEYMGPAMPPEGGSKRYLPNGPTASIQVCVSDVLEECIRRDALEHIVLR